MSAKVWNRSWNYILAYWGSEMIATEIITEEEVIKVHANANFGPQSPREVLDQGIVKYALGWRSGHTLFDILREHGLIHKPRGNRYDTALTSKGRRYLRALQGARTVAEICGYIKGEEQPGRSPRNKEAQ